MGKKARSRSGFTLTEIVIATMVVGIGVAGVMSLVVWMVRANDWSGDLSNASTLGQDKLEDLLDTSYLNIAGGSDTVDEFQRTWTINTSPSNTHKTINIHVEWTRMDNQVSDVDLVSVLSNPSVKGIDLSPLNLDGL